MSSHTNPWHLPEKEYMSNKLSVSEEHMMESFRKELKSQFLSMQAQFYAEMKTQLYTINHDVRTEMKLQFRQFEKYFIEPIQDNIRVMKSQIYVLNKNLDMQNIRLISVEKKIDELDIQASSLENKIGR